MAPEAKRTDGEPTSGEGSTAPVIVAHESAPDTLVFTEDGNTDGWIATDLTIDVREYD